MQTGRDIHDRNSNTDYRFLKSHKDFTPFFPIPFKLIKIHNHQRWVRSSMLGLNKALNPFSLIPFKRIKICFSSPFYLNHGLYSLILRVPDQNGISWLYNMLEIYHSGPKPSIYSIQTSFFFLFHSSLLRSAFTTVEFKHGLNSLLYSIQTY